MLRWTGGATVESIIEATVGAEQQTIASNELWLTELKLVERVARLEEAIQGRSSIVNHILMKLNSMVDAVRT